jgi:hypothetical protein
MSNLQCPLQRCFDAHQDFCRDRNQGRLRVMPLNETAVTRDDAAELADLPDYLRARSVTPAPLSG